MVTLLPADRYIVINKTILNESDRTYIVSLYEPIIGLEAVSLYFTLWRDLDRTKIISADYTHHHLMTILKSNLDTIKLARKTLEAMGLIKTYYKEGEPNSYVYELYSPLNPKEFFQNPIFNVVLYNNIGKEEYENLKKEFGILTIPLKDYTDITTNFDEIFKTSSADVSFEAIGKTTREITMEDQVDFDFIISSLPKGLTQEKTFNKRTKELINNLSLAYNLDTLKMTEIIRLAINEKGYIDKSMLRIETRKYYQYNNSGKLPTLVYRSQPEYLKSPSGDTSKKGRIIKVFETTTPYDFLASKYNNGSPTQRDLKLLEYLLQDVGLKPAVVNVLVDYVLKKNNNKLNTAFVETIAGQWKRLHIETALDAMNVAEKEHKKYTSKLAKETKKKASDTTPVWFDEKITKENMNEEEQKELDTMLNKYRD